MPKWIKIKDGVLALEGTPMQVVYRPEGDELLGDYHIYHGDRYMGRWNTLGFAKLKAEHLYAALQEIGAAP